MITIKTTEPKTLRFAIDIEGSQATPIVNYIIESDLFSYSFKGRVKSGSVCVDIPELDGMITAGQYDTKVEVILDENYYPALEGKVKIETPVEVKIQEAAEEVAPLVEKKVAVKLTSEKPTKKKKIVEKKKEPFKPKPTVNLMEDILDE